MNPVTAEAQGGGAVSGADRELLEQHQYLTFMQGGEVYAIGILHVKEIIGYGQVTPVPMMPDYIRGVINLRGRVVPVVDLAARLGRESTPVGKRTCIIILEVEGDGEVQDMGMVVDAVNEVVEIGPDQMAPPPAFGAMIRSDFIEAMGRVDGGFVVVLGVEQVLSVQDMNIGDERLAVPGGARTGALALPGG
jgi:purine-binding chemotaxis protein CheW